MPASPLDNLSADPKAYLGGVLQPKGYPSFPSDWTVDLEKFDSVTSGVELFGLKYRPQNWKGGKALIVVHGLGEHSARYLHFPHYLRGDVNAVIAYDQIGHGRSGGLRGHVDRFDQYMDDAVAFIQRTESYLKDKFGQADIHLLGHSMGGLVCLRMLMHYADLPIQSATVSAPLLGVRVKVPVYKKYFALGLSKFWGELQLGNGLDAHTISHDPEVVKTYLADRLVHSKVSLQFYLQLQDAMGDTLTREHEIKQPVQFLIPMEDQIVDPGESLNLFKRLNCKDKELKSYGRFYHESFNEGGDEGQALGVTKEQAFEDLAQWIRKH